MGCQSKIPALISFAATTAKFAAGDIIRMDDGKRWRVVGQYLSPEWPGKTRKERRAAQAEYRRLTKKRSRNISTTGHAS